MTPQELVNLIKAKYGRCYVSITDEVYSNTANECGSIHTLYCDRKKPYTMEFDSYEALTQYVISLTSDKVDSPEEVLKVIEGA